MWKKSAKDRFVAIGQTPRASAGFSLIELLVVILIIGLGVRAVSFNIGGNKQRQILQEAKQFVNAASLIAEESVLNRQQWGIDFYREISDDGNDVYGYRWLALQAEYWQMPDQKEDQPNDVLFSPGVKLRLEFDEIEQDIELKKEIVVPPSEEGEDEGKSEGRDESRGKGDGRGDGRGEKSRQEGNSSEQDEDALEPHVWMLSSGEMTPFKLIIFTEENPDNQIVINGDELGRVRIESRDNEDDED